MSPSLAMKQLMRDVDADVRAYRTLAVLLEEQFTAALGHNGPRLKTLANDITALVDALESRRQARVTLVRQLLPQHPQPDMAAVLALLPAASRDAMAAWWDTLQVLVRECKQSNARNGRLITDQHAIFQRVLHGEEDHTYAAA